MQVVVLVGTGWSYMTPFLRDREKRLLMVVIPLQVCHGSFQQSCQAGLDVWGKLLECVSLPLCGIMNTLKACH